MSKKSLPIKTYLSSRAFSFKYAFNGLHYAFQTQKNISIHFIATILVLTSSALLKIELMDLAIIMIVIGFVWVAEIFNTAVEKIVDLCSPQYHPLAKISKDLAAAAVLVSAITAALVGAVIFIPYLIKLFW